MNEWKRNGTDKTIQIFLNNTKKTCAILLSAFCIYPVPVNIIVDVDIDVECIGRCIIYFHFGFASMLLVRCICSAPFDGNAFY